MHWDNPTPVVAAVVEYEGRVLLARNRAWPEKMFALVTGFLERDEAPAAAVLREVKEETDLDGRAAHLIGVYEFARMNQVIIAYHVPAHSRRLLLYYPRRWVDDIIRLGVMGWRLLRGEPDTHRAAEQHNEWMMLREYLLKGV